MAKSLAPRIQSPRGAIKTLLEWTGLLNLLLWAKELAEFVRDARRYIKHATPTESARLRRLSPMQLQGQVTRDYHRIEKGLALRDPRRPFGIEVGRRLSSLAPGLDVLPDEVRQSAQAALVALGDWNATGARSSEAAPLADSLAEPESGWGPGQLFRSRRSVRDFSSEPVDPAVIEEAISLAANSPSVCNRQPWRVRLYSGPEAQQALRFQNGNSGFGHAVPIVALVTVELGLFAGPGERNQAWVEGGIYASSLVWALKALGLDTCMLNLSITNSHGRGLRRFAQVPESEVPIVMIAIGHAAPEHRVARSQRQSLDELLVRPLQQVEAASEANANR